ncbi:MAG: hypothetical protein U1F39_04570 [Steroidobacteraceae bacterium]
MQHATHVVDVHEAAERLEELMDLVDAGDEVQVAVNGEPCVRLEAIPRTTSPGSNTDEGSAA